MGSRSAATAGAPPRSLVEHIPAELKELDRWAVCQIVPQPDGTTKKFILIAGTTGRGNKAESDKAKTWRSFDVALRDAEARGLWLVFVFDCSLPYFFIDIDDRVDPVTGAIDDFAMRLVTELDTYTELSASGDGVHIIGRGAFSPRAKNTTPPVERYPVHGARFCLFTGKVLPGHVTIEDRQAQLDAYFPDRITHTNGSRSSAGFHTPAGELTETEVERIIEWVKPLWTKGRRHHMALYLGGYLGKRGISRNQATSIIEQLAEDDPDPGNALTACHDSYDSLEAGADVSGWYGLKDVCGLSEDDLAPLSAILAGFWQRSRPRLLRVSRGAQLQVREVTHA
jgi:hypothetical protein